MHYGACESCFLIWLLSFLKNPYRSLFIITSCKISFASYIHKVNTTFNSFWSDLFFYVIKILPPALNILCSCMIAHVPELNTVSVCVCRSTTTSPVW